MNRKTGLLTGLLFLLNSHLATATESPASVTLPADLLQPLLEEFQQQQHTLGNTRYVALMNYRQPSWEPRFYLIDPESEHVVAAYRVAHGRGSDPVHDGFAEFFSDRQGSLMSSLGFFRTGETYMSQEPGHGLSLRLDGLSDTNSNAYDRAIVIHANHYMEQEFIDNFGKPGRSHGCFVFSARDRDIIVNKLHGGALIYAAH